MIKIIAHNLCPYVQRVVILMLEKNISFERIDIDLDNRPAWLMQSSPTGKVPLLITENNGVLFESQVICDYLDEVSPASLQPIDSFEKAQHRAWTEFGTHMLNIIADIIYRDIRQNNFENSISQLIQQLQFVEAEHSGGSYFAGEDFHLIDAIYASLFRYFPVLQQVTSSPILRNMPRLSAWQQSLSKRSSVQGAVPSHYNELLIKFITAKPSYLSRRLKETANNSQTPLAYRIVAD